MVRRAVKVAEDVCGEQTVLVAGSHSIEVAAACKPLQGFLVINSEFARGIGKSIACGIRSIAHVADGALFLLADQPRIRVPDLLKLIDTWTPNPNYIVASAYADTIGPPIIFPRRDFATLAKLDGDQGARSIIDSARDRLITIPCERAAYDVDHPDDLATN